MEDINIYFLDMPCKIGATVILEYDGTYSVYLNSRLTFERQKQSLIHEIRHIKNDDFFSTLSATEIENILHKDD